MQLAPIVLFCYKRLDTLKRTVAALQQNLYAAESDLFIFSDAAKSQDDKALVADVRKYIKTISGFKNIHIREAEANKGLATSIITGVTKVFQQYDKVIVVEDDLVTAANFLAYMNEALNFYQNHPKVFSISGYTIPVELPNTYGYDGYFLPRASSWSWATWKDRWQDVDWQVTDFAQFKNNRSERAAFNAGGSDMYQMLEKQMEGKIDSWAIRWCYHQFRQRTYTLYPTISKVQNIGFNKLASHTNGYNRYATPLDNGQNLSFRFPSKVAPDQYLLAQFQSFFSLNARALGKIKTYLYKFNLLKLSDG